MDPLPSPPALVTLGVEGVHMPPDRDTDEEDRGVEQEKLEPIVIACDTCGRCEKEGESGAREEATAVNNLRGHFLPLVIQQ